jgi:hypothetical protein
MTSPLHNQSRPLLTGLSAAGIDLGSEVEAARKVQNEAQTVLARYEASYRSAADALLHAGPSDHRKATDTLIKATASLQAAQAANRVIIESAEHALNSALTKELPNYTDQLVTAFSGVVEEHRLNELAPYLPDFTVDGFKLDVMSLSANQTSAVLAWRAGSEHLHPIWDGYVRLAKYQGFDLGPVDLDSLYTNRFTSVVLGADTAAQSMAAAQVFAAASAGVEASKQIRQLIPFVASAIAGSDLQLRTPDEANAKLRGFNQVTAPGAVSVW